MSISSKHITSSQGEDLLEDKQALSLFQLLSLKDHGRTYLLVDVVLFADFWIFWSDFQPSARQCWCYLFQETAYEHLSASSPMLVEILEGQAGETLFYWLVEQPEAFKAGCMLISSSLTLSQLHQFWQPRITCLYPGEQQDLLPCYSPSVMTLFWSTLSSEEQMSFLGQDTVLYLPCDEVGLWSRLSVDVLPSERQKTAEAGVESPYRLSESQYELLSRDNRRHKMANDVFLRLSQHVDFELDIEHIKYLFLSSIVLAEAMYPNESVFAFETFAVYRFILADDYFEDPEFTSLMEKHDLRTSIQTYYQSCFTPQDTLWQQQQTQWISSLSQGGVVA